MASSPCKNSGSALCVHRYSAYPSPALTDLLVGFLQSNSSPSHCGLSLTVVSRSDDVLSPVTPFLLFAGPSNKCVAGDGESAACSASSTSSSCAASKEQLFSLSGAVPLSDWAAARCLVNRLAAAGASTGFLLGMQVAPRELADTFLPQKKGDSPVVLRYTVEAAVDVCEAWWALAEARAAKRGKENDFDEAEEGYAKYFAALLGTPTAEAGQLQFLFDTQFPTLADMGLHALLRRFPSAATLLQRALLPRVAAASGDGATSPDAAAAAARLAAWTERVTAVTGPVLQSTGSSGGEPAGAAAGAKTRGKEAQKCCREQSKKTCDAPASAAAAPEAATQNAVNDEAGAPSGAAAGTATPTAAANGPDATGAVNFLKQIVESDLRTGKHTTVVTRFPPEPNGFLHLGHAKSICVNFGLATAFNGRCHLRFDDTNPMKEEMLYIESIKRDVHWMGGDWGKHLYYASDYFEQLYTWAEDLIKKGLAFVDDDDQEEIRRKRGSITQPGENSGFRNRSVEENLDLFRRMRAGEFEEGSRVLRAKIDMAHSNMNMRDPIMYRILKKPHPRTGDKWVIYPTYDYTHGQSDSLEGITHSICTLEFDLHRALYDWFQEKLDIPRTRQIEFARLNVTNTVMSKRKLLALVVEKWVDGWDDPRLPTLAGLRRRGVPAVALRTFCDRVGVARRESVIQVELLERCIREALHPVAPRRFAIQQPIRVVISNYEGSEEVLAAPNHPENPSFGSRQLHFTRNIFIDRDDFMETPVPGYHRLTPGGEVRLKHAYWIKCEEVVKDAEGRVVELRCTYDPQTKMAATAPCGRKVKGTIQWLSDKDAAPAELRIYGRLFNKANPEEVDENTPDASWRDHINPESLKVYKGLVERCVTDPRVFPPQSSVQFERLGFFTRDASTLPEGGAEEEEAGEKPATGTATGGAGGRAGAGDLPVFNLTVSLQEGFTSSEDVEKEKAKAQDKLAREKAALERQKKKEEREMKKLMKEKQLQQQAPAAPGCKRESAARS